MVKPTESFYRKRAIDANLSSFERSSMESVMKNPRSNDKKSELNGHQMSEKSPSPKVERTNNTSEHSHDVRLSTVSQLSTFSRKKDQWNVERDIPVGTVRNNMFLPEPKQQPHQLLKHQKRQWDTSNIPKGSVAARIQESNQPHKISGGNIGPANSSKRSPRRYPKGGSSSRENQQESLSRCSDSTSSKQQSSQLHGEEREKTTTNRRWEPSREIPAGTIKGRVTSLYGQSVSIGMKSTNISTLDSRNSKEQDSNMSFSVMAKEDETKLEDESSNDDEDQWIIPDRNVANTQVFASDWGEAIPVKSAESDDWETPSREWTRAGELQAERSPSKEIETKVTKEQKNLLPYDNAPITPIFDKDLRQIENENIRKPLDHSPQRITITSAILAPPSKDANVYHKPERRSFANHESGEIHAFGAKSDSSLSQSFNNDFKNFAIESEAILPQVSTISSYFQAGSDCNRQLSNETSDAFGFPLPQGEQEKVEHKITGEIIGGDEFFDAPGLPNDYGLSSTNDDGIDFDLHRHSSMTSDASTADAHNSSVNEFDSRKDFKKKRKGFFKGLFGRKSKEKENGKVKQLSTKDNRKLLVRKELSYSKSSLSESMTSVSELGSRNSSRVQAHDTVLLDQKKGKKSEGSLSGLNLENSEERNQRERLPRNSIMNSTVNSSGREKLFDEFGEHQLSKVDSQDGSMTMIDVKDLNDFNGTFSTQNNVFKESVSPGALDGSKALGVFDDPKPDSEKMRNKIENMFLGSQLDEIGMKKMDVEDEFNREKNVSPHNAISITQNLSDGNRSQNCSKEDFKNVSNQKISTKMMSSNFDSEASMSSENLELQCDSEIKIPVVDGMQQLNTDRSDNIGVLGKERKNLQVDLVASQAQQMMNKGSEDKLTTTDKDPLNINRSGNSVGLSERKNDDVQNINKIGTPTTNTANPVSSASMNVSESLQRQSFVSSRNRTKHSGVSEANALQKPTTSKMLIQDNRMQSRSSTASTTVTRKKPNDKSGYASTSRKPMLPSRLNATIHSNHSTVSSLRSNFLPNRYTKTSVFNKVLNVNDVGRQDDYRGPQKQSVHHGRRMEIISRKDQESQYAHDEIGRINSQYHSGDKVGTNSKRFSRAAYAYKSITKNNPIEGSEDHRKYLSITATSTSTSDISCASTYDSYQKMLGESLRKASVTTITSSEYSRHTLKSTDDSSIESDIRVLRSILRRPRLNHDNERVIKASRQIEGFPTYDTESATDPMQRVGLRLLSSAIIPIQTEVRRFLAMRQTLTRMWALIVVQAHSRRFLARKKLLKAKKSIVTIQSVVRGHLARNDVIDKHICAIEIQRFVRGYLATMQVYEDIYKVTLVQSLVRMRISMDYAAYRMSLIIQLQAIARGFLERRRRAHLDRCAKLIQASWRCFYNRLTYQFDLLDIIIIQSLWRKKLGVRVAGRKVQERRHAAATRIQAEWRAYDSRMDFLCYISARTIQTRWRSHICRMNYVDYQSSTIIQSVARMFLCRLQYVDYQAATAIQSLARMYFCRIDYVDYQYATKIQTIVRMFLCRSQYLEYQCASKIQSIGRMYLCRYDYLEYRAATRLQAAVRMYLCRSGYIEYKCASKIQSIGRMYLCRYDYLEYRAATTLQAVVRMYLCRSGYIEYRSATVIQAAWRSHDCRMDYIFYTSSRKLQSIGRMYLCRIKYTDYQAKNASTVIQTKWRAYMCRKIYIENYAATMIQAKWRSYDCSSMYKRYCSARAIQKTWRSYDCQMNFLHFLADIMIVQSVIRRFLVQRKVKFMKNHAATVIQRQYRSFACLKSYTRTLAAITMQSAWRCFYHYNEYERHKASIKIQSAWRGLICYIDYHEYLTVRRIQSAWRAFVCRRNYEHEKAAILIQCTWRGFVFYADYMFALSDIVVVQKQMRGWLARRVANKRRNHLRCAIHIQAQMRGYIQRKKYLSKLYAAVSIETAWRNAQAKKLTSELLVIRDITKSSMTIAKKQSSAAIKVQQVFRGSLCRNALKVHLAAVLIQSRIRGKQARIAARLHIAARRIQSLWRAYFPRQNYLSYIAARKIQATWRRHIPRQCFLTFIAARCIQNSWRSMKANQHILLLRKEYCAAMLIQSVWRGFVSYTDFVFTLSDVVSVQRIARGYLSRKRYYGTIRANIEKMKEKSNGAITVQKIYRGFQARQNYWYTLGCAMQIQSWWRGRRVYRSVQKEVNALLTIQCFVRCTIARQVCMQRRFVFMLIQTAELERSKKLKVLKKKEQAREDMEENQRDAAARVIQRFFLHANEYQVDQLVLATKRRKNWRNKMKKEKHFDDVEEALLEDVWIGLVAKSNLEEEPFTRHYANVGHESVDNTQTWKHKVVKHHNIVDDESGYKQSQETALKFVPHPTSSIRIVRKADAVDLDDDFQLEEAFIDAEICHAKERRQNIGKFFKKNVVDTSSGSLRDARSSRNNRRESTTNFSGKNKSCVSRRDRNDSKFGENKKFNVLTANN